MNNRFSQTAVSLNEGSMEEAALKIRTATEEIKNSLEKIKTEIAGVDNAWKDKNAEVYIEKFNVLQQSFPGFYNHAYALNSFLTGVVKAYRENVLEPTSRAVNEDGRR